MKHLLLTTIAAVVLTGCLKSPEEKRHILLDASAKGQTEVVRKALEEGKHSEYDQIILKRLCGYLLILKISK